MYEESFKGASRVVGRNFKGVLGKFQRCLQIIPGKFPECFMKILGCFKSVSSKFDMFLKICFKEVTRFTKRILMAFQANFKGDSRVFQGLFNEVSSVLQASFLGGFQEYIEDISRVFQQCLKGDSG